MTQQYSYSYSYQFSSSSHRTPTGGNRVPMLKLASPGRQALNFESTSPTTHFRSSPNSLPCWMTSYLMFAK